MTPGMVDGRTHGGREEMETGRDRKGRGREIGREGRGWETGREGRGRETGRVGRESGRKERESGRKGREIGFTLISQACQEYRHLPASEKRQRVRQSICEHLLDLCQPGVLHFEE